MFNSYRIIWFQGPIRVQNIQNEAKKGVKNTCSGPPLLCPCTTQKYPHPPPPPPTCPQPSPRLVPLLDCPKSTIMACLNRTS